VNVGIAQARGEVNISQGNLNVGLKQIREKINSHKGEQKSAKRENNIGGEGSYKRTEQ